MRKKPYKVAKKSYSYVELINMPKNELQKIKRLLRDNVTRNIRKLKKAGYNATPATIGLSKSIETGIVPKISLLPAVNKSKAGKTKISETQKLIGEIFEYQKFQESATGTVYGMRRFENETYERVGDAYKFSSEASKRKYWELYDEQREMIEDNGLNSSELQKQLADYFSTKDGKVITKKRSNEWENMVNVAYDKALGASDGEVNTAPSPFRLNT